MLSRPYILPLLYALMASYVLTLSILPCLDTLSHALAQTEIAASEAAWPLHSHDHEHEHEHDHEHEGSELCSPFCACHSCQVQVSILVYIEEKQLIPILPTRTQTSLRALLRQGGVWRPPIG